MARPRSVAVLGATGSIGEQAAAILAADPDRFDVVGLAASGSRLPELAEQVVRLRPDAVALAQTGLDLPGAIERAARRASLAVPHPEILEGPDAAARLAARGADTVLNGITGSVGLEPTLAALHAGSTLALANKESLVAGGALVRAAMRREDQIVPVDSEHSAIAQALRAGRRGEAVRLVVTASGGPFRGRTRAELADVGPDAALAHPTWSMGPVVTINSATMVNKALEVIEAHWLFSMPMDAIDVVVHPQSIVHSMVQFRDGSTIAQASPPTMAIPIALALAWPDRLTNVAPPCDFRRASTWEFEPLDEDTFPAVRVARSAVTASETHPAVYNAANEQCVAAFLAGALPFLGIVDTVSQVVGEFVPSARSGSALTLADVVGAEAWARARADELIGWIG